MCLIIANPSCEPIPADYIVNAYSHNSDGFGYMTADGGSLNIARGMHNLAGILEIFESLTAAGNPYVAHFRFATHGTTNADNCHPFPITARLGGVAMAHNGTLSGKEWRSKHKSDTALLVDRLQTHIKHGHLTARDLFAKNAPKIAARYANSIGTDKLVFMNGDGDINIYNEDNGLWYENVWYSNLYSLCSKQSLRKATRVTWKASDFAAT